MNFDKLKESARKYEQGGDWKRAIEVYQKAIQEFESGHDPAADLSIYNRVGDLYLKANEPAAAVQAYERAADLYREQGFYNNAIALCGKILRVNPGRTQTYLRLAHLHAHKNVVTETKKNLLEYLDRMNGANQLDEAFKSLKVFSEQFPGNKDLRMMLSDLLRASSRDEEAKEQLEKLASDLEARGDSIGARKTLQKLHAIESAGPSSTSPHSAKGDLIFLDTGLDLAGRSRPGGRRTAARVTPPPHETPAVPPAAAEHEPEPLKIESSSSLAADHLPLDSAQVISDEALLEATSLDVGKTLGFEPTIDEAVDATGVTPLEGLELDPTAAEGLDLTRVEGLEVDEVDASLLDVEHSPSLQAGGIPKHPAEAGTGDAGGQVPGDVIELVESLDVMDEDLNLDLSGLPGEPPPEDFTDLGLDLLVEEAEAEAPPPPPPAPPAPAPPPPAPPPPAPVAELTIAELEERVFDDPEDPDLHRALGEALIASGDTDRGLEELDLALTAYETREQWERATDLVNELILLEPSAVRHYQKMVELAYLTGDRGRLVSAYLELGDALMRVGALDKALAVYSRVAEHDPDNQRARLALETLSPVDASPAPPAAAAPSPVPPAPTPEAKPPAPPAKAEAPAPAPKVEAPAPAPKLEAQAPAPKPEPAAPAPPATRTSSGRERPPADAGAEFIDLGALIMDETGPRDTRMKVENEEQSGDEQRDFQEMLQQFKRGIDANIDAEDFQSHYDLGVAFKEMGLLDEAIAEFQKALRAPEGRLRTSEALGVAFYEKGQFAISEAILRRAVESLGASDDEQIGLIYWMGRAAEAQDKTGAAVSSYERVMAVDIGFQDTRSRMKKLTGRRA